MSKHLLRALLVLVAHSWLLGVSVAEAQRVRVIVLTFEGQNADDARAAAVRGLETTYEMVDESAAIDAAGEIGVDVSTPDGMSAVVAHLGIELVIGGFVEGRGRRATTTIWVSDIQGNELSRRTTGPPTGRGAGDLIASAAYDAAAEALVLLHPPDAEPEPEPVLAEPEPEPVPEPVRDDGPRSARWVQPLIRGLVGIDLRNRTASAGPNNLDRFDADFFPVIEIALDAHPLSFLQGPENGLYLSLRMGFSAGLTYFAQNEEQLAMNVYHLEGDVGYAGIIADVVEIGGTLGLGLDAVNLEPPLPNAFIGDFPGTEFFNFRPGLFVRARLFQDFLILAGGIGGRIFIGTGAANNYTSANATFPNPAPPSDPTVYWGVANGGGLDFNLGLEGIIDPGFSYAARFGYTGAFVGFSGDAFGPAERSSMTDEAWHILLQVGWAFVPDAGPVREGEAVPEERGEERRGPVRVEEPGESTGLEEFDHLDDERPPGYR